MAHICGITARQCPDLHMGFTGHRLPAMLGHDATGAPLPMAAYSACRVIFFSKMHDMLTFSMMFAFDKMMLDFSPHAARKIDFDDG